MIRSKRYPLHGRPVLAGLLWAAMFVPLFLLLMLAMGKPFHGLTPVLVLIALAAPGGLLWGFTVNAIVRRRESKK